MRYGNDRSGTVCAAAIMVELAFGACQYVKKVGENALKGCELSLYRTADGGDNDNATRSDQHWSYSMSCRASCLTAETTVDGVDGRLVGVGRVRGPIAAARHRGERPDKSCLDCPVVAGAEGRGEEDAPYRIVGASSRLTIRCEVTDARLFFEPMAVTR